MSRGASTSYSDDPRRLSSSAVDHQQLATSVSTSVLAAGSAPGPSSAGGASAGESMEGGISSVPTRPPRKLNRSANQLHRNQACLPCRRRRIKCDAGRPHCSSCVRSYRFLARTQPNPDRDSKGVQCVYEDSGEGEDDNGDLVAVGSDDPRLAVRKLQARITELQTALAQLTSPTAAQHQHAIYDAVPTGPPIGWGMDTAIMTGSRSGHTHPSPTSAPPSATAPGGHLYGAFPSHIATQSSPIVSHPSMGESDLQSPINIASLRQQGLDPIALGTLTGDMTVSDSLPQSQHAHTSMGGIPMKGNSAPVAVAEGVDESAGNVGGSFLDIFWPGWPPRLPTPSMLDHLVQTFFNVVPSISRIFHRHTFMARLALPPTHKDFPSPALLHAICAVTARYSAAVHTISVEESMRQTNEEIRGNVHRPQGMSLDEEAANQDCFAERHARFALLEMQVSTTVGRRLLELAQAQAVLAVYYQQHAKWIDGWMMTGSLARLAAPLGLMLDYSGHDRTRNAVIDGPSEDWDREERRLLTSYIMMMDFISSTTSGWGTAVILDEIMSRLPAARADFVRGSKIPENPQTWYSADLYTHHPVVDNFVLCCKGLHLLGQVVKFKRKCQALDDPLAARNTIVFRKLDSDISAFHYSFPAELRDPLHPNGGLHKGVDADLVGAHLIPHVSAIKLHESFADLSNPHDPSAIRILTESRAVLSIVYLLTGTTLDFSYILNPAISCDYFFVAARTFVLFYQQALESRNYQSAKLFLSEIEVFRMAFRALSQRFALGARHGGMVDQMLQTCHDELGIPDEIRTELANLAFGSDSWRHMPPPYAERTQGWHLAGTRPVRPGSFPDDVQPHHPLNVLFLSQDGHLRDKKGRGLHSTVSNSPNNSGGTPDRPEPPTPPVTITDGGVGWLQHMSPATSATLMAQSPDEMGDMQRHQFQQQQQQRQFHPRQYPQHPHQRQTQHDQSPHQPHHVYQHYAPENVHFQVTNPHQRPSI